MTADPLEGTPHSMGDPNTSMGPGESIPTKSAQATADSPPSKLIVNWGGGFYRECVSQIWVTLKALCSATDR